MAKRRRTGEDVEDEDPTPRKTRRTVREDAESNGSPVVQAETPSGRKGILRGTPSKLQSLKDTGDTPRSLRKVLFSTPAKPDEQDEDQDQATPTAVKKDRNDQSARRKSQRMLQKAPAATADSEDEDAEQDEAIAQRILGEDDEDEDDDEEVIALAEATPDPDTPSKSGRQRGRPKGRRRERTPSPPPDLPPHEMYFFQNRTGGNKTSSNTLPSNILLNHEDYFKQISAYKDPHAKDIERLKRLHKRAFDQWCFELDEGFNLCLYGYGSKRSLVMQFAEELYWRHKDGEKEKPAQSIVVVSGYTPGLTLRDILTTVASVVIPKETKLPAQPAAVLDLILAELEPRSKPWDLHPEPASHHITLIIHSLDHANLRKAGTQSTIARLAAHPAISLVATCDTPNFPLLWDTALLRQFRWLYHDCTTLEPYAVEIDAVDEVNALLGRSGRRLGGKDGVAFVLKSLPENARNLFRILVAEQLALMDSHGDTAIGAARGDGTDLHDEDILGASDDERAASAIETPSRRGRGRPAKKPKPKPTPARAIVSAPEGVEYRHLYHKAVEEFVCSSELSFRTLLKEFHDHQIIESKKDVAGTERLSVPFGREELEGMLEELV